MESILLVFLSSFLLTVNSHPRNSDLIPKDYYKRQILQPIPGYIPVYIKADGEPIIRSEKIKLDSNVHHPKASGTGENQLSKKHVEPKSAITQSEKINAEIHRKESKAESPNFSETSHSQANSSSENKKLAQTEGEKLNSEKKND